VAGSERRTTLSVRMAAERETAVQRDPARTRWRGGGEGAGQGL